MPYYINHYDIVFSNRYDVKYDTAPFIWIVESFMISSLVNTFKSFEEISFVLFHFWNGLDER